MQFFFEYISLITQVLPFLHPPKVNCLQDMLSESWYLEYTDMGASIKTLEKIEEKSRQPRYRDFFNKFPPQIL